MTWVPFVVWEDFPSLVSPLDATNLNGSFEALAAYVDAETARAEAAESTLYDEILSGGGGAVSSVFGRTGTVTAEAGDYTASQVTGALQASNDLSDVSDAGSSRANLHIPVLTAAACVAVANVSSLSGLQTFDGYVLVAGDLVLLTAQSTASQNGLWTAASGAWTRPTEMGSGILLKSRTCAIINGTTYAKTQWLLQTNSTITVDTTSQTWAQISGGGGSGSSTLAGDTDVSITSPSAGQGLVYNSSTGKWNNGTANAENVNTVASSGSGTVTISDPWASPFYTVSDVTLTGNPTFAFPTAAAGKSFTIILRQDGTGNRAVTWPTITWLGGGAAPVLSTAASAADVATFICTDGTHWMGAFTPGYVSEGTLPGVQAGVIGSGDLLVGSVSINTSTGALTFTPASTSSPAWVLSSLGVLIGVSFTSTAQTKTPSLPATSDYAVVGVEIDTNGNISLVKGSDTATQLNTGTLIASHSPATSSGKMRIADFAYWNNSGTINFGDHTTTPSQGVNWIDRRPWARGAFFVNADTSGTHTTTSSTYAQLPNTPCRIECSGVPLRIEFDASIANSVGDAYSNLIPVIDGTQPSGSGPRYRYQPNGGQNIDGAQILQTVTPSSGSHLVSISWATNTGTLSCTASTGSPAILTIEELVRQNSSNGTA